MFETFRDHKQIALLLAVMTVCFYLAQSDYFTAAALSDHGEFTTGVVTSDPLYSGGRSGTWRADIQFEVPDGATRSGRVVMQPYLKKVYVPSVSLKVLYLPEDPDVYVAGKVKAALVNMRVRGFMIFLLGLMLAGMATWQALKHAAHL